MCLILATLISCYQLDPLAAESKAAKLYTNKTNYNFLFISDADKIDYQLSFKSRVVKSGRQELKNPAGQKVSRQLPLQLISEGEYTLKFSLADDVENKSQTYTRTIIFDKTAPKLQLISTRLCEYNICAKINVNEPGQLYIDNQAINIAPGEQEVKLLATDWLENRNYSFKLISEDQSGNKSEVRPVNITTPDLAGGAGDVFGADAANLWGKQNHYQEQAGKGILYLDFTKPQFSYKFDQLLIPDPVLTYTDTLNGQVNVYGLAPSKQTAINLKLYKRYPSFSQAKQRCLKGNLLDKLQKQNSYKQCVADLLQIPSYDYYIGQINSKCLQIGKVFVSKSCLEYYFNRQDERYLGVKSLTIQHLQLQFVEPHKRELGSIWQEQDQRFTYQTSKLKPGQYVWAKAKLFGSLSVGNIKVSYDGYETGFSNMLKIKPATNLNLGQVAKSCTNTTCKLLQIAYFNQAVNEKGQWETWPSWERLAGGKACGAAASVMVNHYFQKLDASNTRLKSFVFADNNQQLQAKKCARPGAFAVTASDKYCNQSSSKSIETYLKQYGLKTTIHWIQDEAKALQTIKAALNKNHPIIISYKAPLGHILVIKGYTYNNQLIVNDPYRDIQTNYIKQKYDYSGQDAIYTLTAKGKFKINYFIEIQNA